MNSIVLESENLTKVFGDHSAVNDVSFQIKKGEIVVFLGPNGSGKTTTIRMITGYYPPTSGAVRICGTDLSTQREKSLSSLGYLPEIPPLYGEMKVFDFLCFAAGLKGIKEIPSAVNQVIGVCSLESRKNWYCYKLSKGYRQRVGVALCLLGKPPLLVMDEPVSGLDPNQIFEMRNILREYSSQSGIFISSHLLSEAQLIADRIILLQQGKIVGNYSSHDMESMGKERILIKTDMNEKNFSNLVKGHIHKVLVENNSLFEYEVSGNEQFGGLLAKKIVESGKSVYKLQPRELSLEELYLEVMGEGS